MIDLNNIKKGDKIQFTCMYREGITTQVRVVRRVVQLPWDTSGDQSGHVEVRFRGWDDFIVWPREIDKVVEAAHG